MRRSLQIGVIYGVLTIFPDSAFLLNRTRGRVSPKRDRLILIIDPIHDMIDVQLIHVLMDEVLFFRNSSGLLFHVLGETFFFFSLRMFLCI